MRLSPRDPYLGIFHFLTGDAEFGLGRSDAAINQYRRTIDLGFRTDFVYANLSAAYVQAGKTDEAKAALAEARHLNPKLTAKWMVEQTASPAAVFDGLRKAGLAARRSPTASPASRQNGSTAMSTFPHPGLRRRRPDQE
jgi:tetratricopeptide (TPR) repeat protein